MQTPALVKSPTDEAHDEETKTAQQERLRAVRLHALDLVEQLQALAAEQPAEKQPTWIEYIGMVQDVVHFAESSGTSLVMKRGGQSLTTKQMQDFGKLLRDKRNAAGFSRVQLARKAKLSDATIKFIETARHPPSRATLIRLIGVKFSGLVSGNIQLNVFDDTESEISLLQQLDHIRRRWGKGAIQWANFTMKTKSVEQRAEGMEQSAKGKIKPITK